MANKQKYLKDENGEIFSPIVNTDSVMTEESNTNLTTLLSYSRDEVMCGFYEGKPLYRKNIVIESVAGTKVQCKISDASIDIKFFAGKVGRNDELFYAIPFYENDGVFCRVEYSAKSLFFTTGTQTYGNGTITGTVYYTKN